MKTALIEELIKISNKYGQDEDFAPAGRGSCSVKDDKHLFIKRSGASLAGVTESKLVKLDRAELAGIWGGADSAENLEEFALHGLMRSRCVNEEKRPSSDALIHDLIPYTYVVRLHPALANGLICSKNGAELISKLFPDAIRIDSFLPGFAMASEIRRELETFKSAKGCDAKLVFVKNYGLFVAADSSNEIDAVCQGITNTIKAQLKEDVDFSPADTDTSRAALIAPALRMLLADGKTSIVSFFADKSAMRFASKDGVSLVETPFTPQHITGCGAHPLFIAADADIDKQYELISSAISDYRAKHGKYPKIIAVDGLGFFAHGTTKKAADTARALMRDAIKLAIFAETFGGVSPMPKELCDAAIASASKTCTGCACARNNAKRAAEKIVIVTGGAQGIGFGIASEITENGANVVIADLNDKTADAAAAELCEKFGAGKAISCKTDVSSEQSVAALIEKTVLEYGGLDALVNNAGIVRAGSLEEMTVENLDFVTKINYTAYFLCAKYSSRVMKLQNKFNPEYSMDIIQINSKSGLSGSNKNFAYAGSKFGGIGLTQSFALELVPYNIKVNSICPGNFLEGPLWTDPEKGLFVQYLHAGKVPGAKTVDDVRRAYESKVPMNRGCRVPDVARAVLYCMEQQYETGQAIPVTGGQNMLK